jgi:uncharacterized protein YgbK (DUF1537 family)
MQNHPLTPMTDPNLVRVMQAQTRRRSGLIDHKAVAQGEAAIRARIDALRAAGRWCGRGRCGVERRPAAARPGAQRHAAGHRRLGRGDRPAGQLWPGAFAAGQRPAAGTGLQAVVSGSCSAGHQPAGRGTSSPAGRPAFAVDPLRWRPATTWRPRRWPGPRPCWRAGRCWSIRHGRTRRRARGAGAARRERPAPWSSAASRTIARGLVELGVRQLIVAGGETSGACVQALGITQMQIGPQIDPGVPWCHAVTASGGIHLTLKSGNFGTDDFFSKAFTVLA